jgi:hypothetical protein
MKHLAAALILATLILACFFLLAGPAPAHAQTASLSLTWTNSADDSLSGSPCVRTAIRYWKIGPAMDTSTVAKKLAFWDLMTEVPPGGVPVPTAVGTSQSVTIPGFTVGSYLFNVRQKDDADNWSGMSNFIVRSVTDAIRPAPVRVWIAP